MGLHEQFSNERAWRKGPGIADGSDLERAVLGAAKISPNERRQEYLPFIEAIEYAKKHQPEMLNRSKTIKDLRARIAALCSDTGNAVKFYTAVGTPLDIYHGVDAFFEQGTRIVTLDISLREKPMYKADVLLQAAFDAEGRPQILGSDLERAAVRIAHQLSDAKNHRHVA